MPAVVTPIIDTAIGLVVVYIAFSLLTSWLGELINSFTHTRASMLTAAIEQLLSGSPGAPPSAAATAFFANPIFTALKQSAARNPQYLSAQQFSSIVIGTLTPQAGAAAAGPQLIAQLQATANGLGIGPQVSALAAKANGDYKTFVGAMEDWYDDHMDRVSGWYKTHAQKVLFVVAFILALLWNVDTIRVVRAVSCNAAIRASATQLQPGTATTPNQAVIQSVIDTIPLGWSFGGGGYETAVACDGIANAAPAGPLAGALHAPSADGSGTASWIVWKIVGLIVTGIALSLGAPFWFDVLSQLTRVRNAGKKPDSSDPSTAGAPNAT